MQGKNVINLYKLCLEYWPMLILLVFGIFIIFVRSTGSLDGDEAIYAQVARETLAHNSWLTLFWRGEAWLEKPPFLVWSEMIMIKSFGLSEVAVRFPSGIFGVMTVLLVYVITYDFFRNKKSAFVAGFILFSTPLYIGSMRYGMTDTMVTFFITLAIFAVYKSIYDNPKWLRVFGIATGCAIMTKSIIGVIPIIIFAVVLMYTKNQNFITKKEMFYGIILFLVVVVPWHFSISVKFGMQFWKEYLGYHVINRFVQNIIASPYNNYIDATVERLGIWGIVFFLFFINGRDFIKKYKKETIFLFLNFTIIIIIFSLAKTISPYYILPTFPFVTILMGGFIGLTFQKQQQLAIVLAGVSLLNFMPLFELQASDYGESNILVPRLFEHLLHFSSQASYEIATIFIAGFLFVSLMLYKKYQKIIIVISFYIMIGMNIFVPFYPNRSPYMKDVGKFISNNDSQLLTYVFMSNSYKYLTNTLLFYLPLNITTERIRMPKDFLFEKNKNNSLCITLYEDPIKYDLGEILYSFSDGELRYCSQSSVINKQ